MLINIKDSIQNELDSNVLTCKELLDTLFSEQSKLQNNRYSKNILMSRKCVCVGGCVCNSTENGLKGFTPNRGYILGRNCGLMCVGWRRREGKGNFKE